MGALQRIRDEFEILERLCMLGWFIQWQLAQRLVVVPWRLTRRRYDEEIGKMALSTVHLQKLMR